MTITMLLIAMLFGGWSEIDQLRYHAVGPEPVGIHSNVIHPAAIRR